MWKRDSYDGLYQVSDSISLDFYDFINFSCGCFSLHHIFLSIPYALYILCEGVSFLGSIYSLFFFCVSFVVMTCTGMTHALLVKEKYTRMWKRRRKNRQWLTMDQKDKVYVGERKQRTTCTRNEFLVESIHEWGHATW